MAKSQKTKTTGWSLTHYWQESKKPLPSLIMLLPLMAIYEVGVLAYARDYDIVARTNLKGFFEWFGVQSSVTLGRIHFSFLPGLIVVGMLLGLHIIHRDKWKFQPSLYCAMAGESLALALPLFVLIGKLGQQFLPPAAALAQTLASMAGKQPGAGAGAFGSDWRADLVFSIGAGIYEELLFRVIVIAAMHALLVDWLKVPDVWGAVGSIAVSAILFGLYHFSQWRDFSAGYFLLYIVAGVYLAGVYMLRGFGIAAGTHAMYDIYVALARALL